MPFGFGKARQRTTSRPSENTTNFRPTRRETSRNNRLRKNLVIYSSAPEYSKKNEAAKNIKNDIRSLKDDIKSNKMANTELSTALAAATTNLATVMREDSGGELSTAIRKLISLIAVQTVLNAQEELSRLSNPKLLGTERDTIAQLRQIASQLDGIIQQSEGSYQVTILPAERLNHLKTTLQDLTNKTNVIESHVDALKYAQQAGAREVGSARFNAPSVLGRASSSTYTDPNTVYSGGGYGGAASASAPPEPHGAPSGYGGGSTSAWFTPATTGGGYGGASAPPAPYSMPSAPGGAYSNYGGGASARFTPATTGGGYGGASAPYGMPSAPPAPYGTPSAPGGAYSNYSGGASAQFTPATVVDPISGTRYNITHNVAVPGNPRTTGASRPTQEMQFTPQTFQDPNTGQRYRVIYDPTTGTQVSVPETDA